MLDVVTIWLTIEEENAHDAICVINDGMITFSMFLHIIRLS